MADTLSRAYLSTNQAQQDLEQVCNMRSDAEHDTGNINMLQYLPFSEQMIKKLQQATASDSELKQLQSTIQAGWPESVDQVPFQIRGYFPVRDELSFQHGVVFKADRVIVPSSLRNEMRECVHSSHIGTQGCLRRAREAIYWPGMNGELENYMANCSVCNTYAPEQPKEPMIHHEIPSRPWARVACDMFELSGRDYLITVDYFSNYFEVDHLNNKQGDEIIRKLKANSQTRNSGYSCV